MYRRVLLLVPILAMTLGFGLTGEVSFIELMFRRGYGTVRFTPLVRRRPPLPSSWCKDGLEQPIPGVPADSPRPEPGQ